MSALCEQCELVPATGHAQSAATGRQMHLCSRCTRWLVQTGQVLIPTIKVDAEVPEGAKEITVRMPDGAVVDIAILGELPKKRPH